MLELICPHCKYEQGVPMRSGDWKGYNEFTCKKCHKVFYYTLALAQKGKKLDIVTRTLKKLTLDS